MLIDNYIDENTLVHLSKKKKTLRYFCYQRPLISNIQLDIKKANEQFEQFTLYSFSKSHDRFLIIDKSMVYHLGASLKDLGKKWFAFTKMDKNSVDSILIQLEKYV